MRKPSSIVQTFADAKREWRQDFDAARPGRFRRQRTGLYGTADAHYANERAYFEVVEYVRDQERNDPLIKALFNIAVNQRVQGGFRYDPQTGDETLNSELKAWHREWAENPRAVDITGERDFSDAELLVCRSELRDGDVFVLPTADGSLQFLESERCRTPWNSKRNIVHGVYLSDTRRPLSYFFTKGTVDPMARIERVSDFDERAAYDDAGLKQVFHVYNPDRFTQARGVSAMAAAQLKMGILDDIEFSLVIKQQLAACLVGTIEDSKDGPPTRTDFGPQSSERTAGGESVMLEEFAPGLIKRMPAGKTFKIHSPNIPSSETLEHVRRVSQIVGLQLAVPLIMLLMDASETNFSGWRGAVDVARSLFREGQRHLAKRFHREVATYRIRMAMMDQTEFGRSLARAYERIGPKLFSHRWHFPTWPYVQPVQDAESKRIRLSTLQISPRRASAEDGHDFKEIVGETIEDNANAIAAAMDKVAELQQKYPNQSVHWRDLLNRDVYDGGTVTDSLDVPNDNAGSAGKAAAKPATTQP